MADQVYVAIESGSSEIKGDSIVFIKGVTMVSEGHPLLKACPDYFKPVEENSNFNTATIVHHDDGAEPPAWQTEGDEYGAGTGANATGEAPETTDDEGEDGEDEATEGDEDDDSEAPAHEDSNATEHAVALAADHGIDLSTVTGTGTDGKILKSDVQQLIAAAS